MSAMITTAVACSRCGKTLRGYESLARAHYQVRKHKRPDGARCNGHLWVDHKPIQKREASNPAIHHRDDG